MNVLTICGSLRPRSYNRAALHALEELLLERMELIEGISLGVVPPFDPEFVDDPPAPVTAFRQQVADADIVVLASPEYAGGPSGLLKNGLDWLVGSGELSQRAVAVLTVASTGGGWARQALARTVAYQGGFVLAQLGIDAPRTRFTDDGTIRDAVTRTVLGTFADAIVVAAAMPEASRIRRARATLATLDVEAEQKMPFPSMRTV